MAQYNERDWRQTKDTEQLTFTAGEDLPYSEYVREDPIGSHIVISTTQALAIGYVISPKGVLAGEKVDIQMLRGLGSAVPGGGGGSILTTNSIVGDGTAGNEIQLENDELAPGPDEYYGTDGSGAKGFFPLPSGGSGSNVTSFTYDITNETAEIQTDQPGSFQAIWPIKWERVIHVAENGDDTAAATLTTTPYSIQVPYLTFEAAWAAAGPRDLIWIHKGQYTISTTSSWSSERPSYVYCEPGVEITNEVTIVSFDEDGQFYWGGGANFFANTDCFINNTAYFKFVLEGNEATAIAGNQLASLQNCESHIRFNRFIKVGFDLRSWVRCKIAVDDWTSNTELFYTSDPTGTLLNAYGPAQVYVSGRSADKAFLKRETFGGSAGITMNFSSFNANLLQVQVDANWDWMDGYGVDQQAGSLILRGNVTLRKTGLRGNEMPFYLAIGSASGSQAYKPNFKYYGTMVTGGDLYNNTLATIRVAGTYQFYGIFKVSGEDEQSLGTPFPCIDVSNQDVDGEVNVTFDGVYVTGRAASVGPIKIKETNNAANPLRINFLNVLAICESDDKSVGPIYGSVVLSPPLALYPYHSLAMSSNWDPTVFTNGLSVDRTYYDGSVSFSVPEYEGP